MVDTHTLALSVFGVAVVWAFLYWVVPSIVVRARFNQERAELKPMRYLDETGSIHRLSRRRDAEAR